MILGTAAVILEDGPTLGEGVGVAGMRVGTAGGFGVGAGVGVRGTGVGVGSAAGRVVGVGTALVVVEPATVGATVAEAKVGLGAIVVDCEPPVSLVSSGIFAGSDPCPPQAAIISSRKIVANEAGQNRRITHLPKSERLSIVCGSVSVKPGPVNNAQRTELGAQPGGKIRAA